MTLSSLGGRLTLPSESTRRERILGWTRGLLSRDKPLRAAFVIGCARSGTSILGELIASHPQVTYLFEANKMWEKSGDAQGGSHRLDAGHATRRVRQSLRREFRRSARPGAEVLIEKCPRNTLRVPFLRAIFPEARFIHIIRDGRDVACSLVPGMASGRWLHLRPPQWRELETQYEGVVRCAAAWQAILQIALADLEGSQHLEVRYERLVQDPRGTALEVMKFLELPPDSAVPQFTRRIQDRTAGSYQARFQCKWYRDDHEVRVGRWRENLSEPQRSQIETLIGPTLQRLGYATD